MPAVGTIVGNLVVGGLVAACVGLAISNSVKHPDWTETYIISLLVLISTMWLVNEGAGLSVWKWRANPHLAQRSAYIKATSQVAGSVVGRLSSIGRQ